MYQRFCKQCGRILKYKREVDLNDAIKRDLVCRWCSRRINNGESCISINDWFLKDNKYIKNCPMCNKEISYKSLSGVQYSVLNKKLCHSCRSSGNKNPSYGSGCNNGIKKMAELKRGKTYYEIYGEKADEVLRKSKESHAGEKNSCFGRTKEKHPLYGKNWDEIHGKDKAKEMRIRFLELHSGENNPMFNVENRTKNSKAQRTRHARKLGVSLDEYNKLCTGKEIYYRNVWFYTNQNNLTELKNFENRGIAGKEGAYHLDHVYPISAGFIYNIPPEEIGNINNLRFIPWLENILKSNNILS